MRRLAVLGLALWAGQAFAQTTAPAAPRPPAEVGSFLIYCERYFAQCRRVILVLDIQNLASEEHVNCPLPADIDGSAAVRRILAWLESRPDLAAEPVRIGVYAAIGALWPCKP